MEVKAAHEGCPTKLYDTISSFANQDEGGILVFGLDEQNKFEKVGVYDAQDLRKKVMEYCEQMTPVVRPVLTVYDDNEKVFVSAEIPPLDIYALRRYLDPLLKVGAIRMTIPEHPRSHSQRFVTIVPPLSTKVPRRCPIAYGNLRARWGNGGRA